MVENQADYNDYTQHPLYDDSESSGTLSSFTFLMLVLILVFSGLYAMYSASYPEVIAQGRPHYYYLIRQSGFALMGFIGGFFLQFVPEKWFRFLALPLTLLAFIFLLMTIFTPFGVTVMGATRWLKLPYLPAFQSAEVVKIAIIFFLSWWFTCSVAKRYVGWFYVVPLAIVLLFAALILLEKAYSNSVLFLLIAISLCIYGGMKARYIIAFLAFLAVPGFYFVISEAYRLKRLISFVFSGADPSGANYQVASSLNAIREGGLLGKGPGNGTYKFGLLPEVQNDFIFANIAEELGLIGIFFLFLLFIAFAILGYRAAMRSRKRDMFISSLCFGITTMIIMQVLVNVSVVTGLLPPTGIPLPFFSQGGTNLFIIILSCSILYRVMRENGKAIDNAQ